ncbi:hypothetical protein SAMN04488527_12822 [Aliiroseovarius crassostreae]|nr:hypothetical protein SAMN04488527_12822 [Aliiroseovarius crassostreae]
MNTKLHAICDSQGRPIDLFVTTGQVSDYTGATAQPVGNIDRLFVLILDDVPIGVFHQIAMAHRLIILRGICQAGRLSPREAS